VQIIYHDFDIELLIITTNDIEELGNIVYNMNRKWLKYASLYFTDSIMDIVKYFEAVFINQYK